MSQSSASLSLSPVKSSSRANKAPVKKFSSDSILSPWLNQALGAKDRAVFEPYEKQGLSLREAFLSLPHQHKKNLIQKLGEHHLQTLFSISSEQEPAIFSNRFFALGQSLHREGKSDLAATVFQSIVKLPAKSQPISQQAQLQLDILNGTAPMLNQSEFIASQTMTGMAHPATWMGLGAGMGLYRLGKAGALSFILSGAGRGIVTTQWGASMASVLTGLGLEGYGFAAFSRLGHHVAGTNVDGRLLPTAKEVASSYVMLGAIKGVHGIIGANSSSTVRTLSRSVMNHSATLGSMLLSHGILEYAGLRDPQGFNKTIAESIAMVGQFGVMNQISPWLYGRRFHNFLQTLEQQSQSTLAKGLSFKIPVPKFPKAALASADSLGEFTNIPSPETSSTKENYKKEFVLLSQNNGDGPVGKNPRQPLVIAHRGTSAHAPENTMAAFRKAIADGADGVEFDVWVCGSGEVVVTHNRELKKLTGTAGNLELTPLTQLKKLDFGSFKGSQFSGERIPTLDEVFELVKGMKVINVEIKGRKFQDHQIERKVVDLILQHNLVSNVVVSSFNQSILQRIQQINPQIKTGILFHQGSNEVIRQRWLNPRLKNFSAHPPVALVESSKVDEMHQKNKKVFVWTVNRQEQLETCVNCNVDGVISDDPADIRTRLNALTGTESAE